MNRGQTHEFCVRFCAYVCATAYKYAISAFELQGLSLVKCVGMLTIRSYSKSHVHIFSAALAINMKEKDK